MNLAKTEKITGIILAVALALLTLAGSGYFFFTLRVNFVQWLAYNACSPSSIVYLCCFVAFLARRQPALLAVALLPMYYFGTMGLFTFTWNGTNVFAQMSHITMTLNLIWAIYVFRKTIDYKAYAQWLIFGILFFVPYIAFVMYYCRTHTDELTTLLQMAS